MRAYDIPNYDSYINRYNPYDDELDEELEEHLEKMCTMEEEDEQKDYCDNHHLKFNEIRYLLGSRS